MTADTMRQRIARGMSASADDVIVTTPAQSVAPIPLSLPVAALDAAATSASTKPFQVNLTAASPLRIIRIDVRGPSRSEAARLATVTANVVKRAARAPVTTPGFPDLQPQDLVVRDVGPVGSRDIVNGPRRMTAAVAASVVFVLWCSAVTLIAGLARARRAARPASHSAVA
jgi:hypothetical protein